MEEQFHQRYEIPMLEERNQSIIQAQSARKHLDLNTINEHEERYMELRSSRARKQLPVYAKKKASYQSKWHQQL